MAGEQNWINNFKQQCTRVNSNTNAGYIVHRGSIQDKLDGYIYVDTGERRTHSTSTMYTDCISWCSGVACWTQGRAALNHIVPGDNVGPHATFFGNAFNVMPSNVFIATQQPYSVFLSDDEAAGSSLYIAARALVQAFGQHISQRTTIITGYKGRDWSSQSKLTVSPKNGVSLTIP